MPAMTAAFAALDRSQVSHATPQLNVLNRVGGSIGTTVPGGRARQRSLRHAHTARRPQHSLRHRLLVVGRDRHARDHPVHRPDASRVQRPQACESGRRRGSGPWRRWSPAPWRRRWHERYRGPPKDKAAPRAARSTDASTAGSGQLGLAFKRAMVADAQAARAGDPPARTDQLRPIRAAVRTGGDVRALGPRSGRAGRLVARDRRPDARASRGRRACETHSVGAGSSCGAVGPDRAWRCSRRRAPRPDGTALAEALSEFSDDELRAAARVLSRLADYFDALLDDDPKDSAHSTAV